MANKPDLLPGTLDMLILKTLARAPLHGYGVALSIKRLSDDLLTVEEGSLYPALQRLLLQGWVKAEWKMTVTKRRARFYTLTAAGRRQLGIVVANGKYDTLNEECRCIHHASNWAGLHCEPRSSCPAYRPGWCPPRAIDISQTAYNGLTSPALSSNCSSMLC
jgi:transcriptional regulator